MSKKAVWSIIIAVATAGFVVVVYNVFTHLVKTNPKAANLANEGIPVKVVAAEVMDLVEIIGASGKVEPFSYTRLTTRVEAEVESISVDIGDITESNEILLRLDDQLLKTIRKSAKLNVLREQSGLKVSKRFLQRKEALFKEDVIPKAELEGAQLKLDSSRAALAAALSDLAIAEDKLNSATIVAPFAGVVTARFVNPGETPLDNDPVLTIGRLDRVLFAGRVPEEKLAYVGIGQTAEISFNAYPNEKRKGRIVKIDPKVDAATRTFMAYVSLDNMELKLKTGMTGFARIENRRSGIAVPSVSIMNPVSDQATLFIIDDRDKARLIQIKPGITADGMTEIISGVSEGNRVVTVGQLHLREDNRVRIGTETFE